MALSANTLRGLIRYLPGTDRNDGGAVPRLVIFPKTTTPVYGSHMRPTSAPSGTAAKGDFYFDTTAGTWKTHDGTSFRQQITDTSSAQTISGALTVTGALTASSTVAATGAISGPRKVYSAVQTLTAADSGALCVFNSAAGDIYTLPTAAAGLWFDFVVLTTITSNAAKIITASASEFLLGGFQQSTDGTYVTAVHAANGTTIRAWSGNGSTTGGLAQDWFRVVGLSATQWYIWGFGRATGTEATPFATS